MSVNTIINHILSWPRVIKQLLQVIMDAVIVSLCYLLLCYFWAMPPLMEQNIYIWISLAVLYPALLGWLRVYSSIVRYIQPFIVLRLFVASTITMGILFMLGRGLNTYLPNHFLIDLELLSIISSLLPRIFFVELVRWRDKWDSQKVAIYGAGEAGLELKSALETNSEYRVIAFIDDLPDLQNRMIQGLPVISINAIPRLVTRGLEEVLLAIPTASRSRRKEIINRLEPLGLHIRTVPKLHEILNGKAKVAELKDITSEDLLARDPVSPMQELMSRDIRNKTIMVTGAGGTIGGQICREIINLQPEKLIIFEASELALYSIEQDLLDEINLSEAQCEVVPVLGSVCNAELVSRTLSYYQVETIFHAAAYKHVPMVELNPLQGMNNNAIGTWVLANAASNAGVNSFVLVSTDKAVRPPNVMGASKRVAELCVQAIANKEHSNKCRYTIVRFGNVLGSSGSVIPKFTRQIAAGGPVTVTDKSMTRYFMTVAEAAQLVIQAGGMGENGEVFVLDMGDPVNIYDLAIRNIRLYGLEPKTVEHPEGDIEVVVTGIRPGEKLFEELLIEGASPTAHSRIFKFDEPRLEYIEAEALLNALAATVDVGSVTQMYEILKTCDVISYKPNDLDTASGKVSNDAA